jgi:parvulin-like peptidyl-prolyl isomerase
MIPCLDYSIFRLKTVLGFLIIIIGFQFSAFAQNEAESITVGIVGGEHVTYNELIENFKTGSLSTPTYKNLEDFLPIYLDYKAKILAGKDQGLYQDSVLVAEHQQYVKQAAYSFWLEKEIKASAFEEFKYRSGLELKSFHILIAVDENASEREIDSVKNILSEAKSELENGNPPEEVDQKYSTVRGGRSMGGDLPWISAGRTVKDFEDELYALEPGEISEPFRTQFGYHIVWLQDKRERTPSRLVQHIYVRGTNDSTKIDKINEAYQDLEDGTSWRETVASYTEDQASSQNAGNIGWINYLANFPVEFIDLVMNLRIDKSYSEPVSTNYGYHIFRVDSVETYSTEEEKNEALRARLADTPYYEESNSFVLNYLEEKFERPVSEEQLLDITTEYFPEFEEQSDSYLHGLVVFKLNELMIWDPATVDTVRLRNIYEANLENYQYPERPFYYFLTAQHDSTLNKAIDFMNNGGSPDSLQSAIQNLIVNSDSSSVNFEQPFDQLQRMDIRTFSDKFDYKNRRGVLWMQDRLAARRMTFDEAFNRLFTLFQPQREKEWIQILREEYNVTPMYDNLQEAYQKDF